MRLSLCALVLMLASCAPAGPRVVVQLVTDYAPVRDFDAIELSDGARDTRFEALVDRSYGRAVRVTELELVSASTLSLTLALQLGGSVVQAQPRRVTPVAGSTTVVTFLITRDCAGVSCPDAAASEAIACVGGLCVSPECSPEHPELCPACAGGCPGSSIACVENACRPEGVCFASARDDRCATGEVCVIDEGCREPVSERDGGPSPDAGGPDARDDAGAGCALDGVVVVTTMSGPITAFGLARSADDSMDVRSLVAGNSSMLTRLDGTSLGTGYFAMGFTGPSGAALLDDGGTAAMVFTHIAGGTRFVAATDRMPSTDVSVGGRCPSAHCIAELDGRFAVLRGPTDLTFVELDSSSTILGMTDVGTGTTAGGIRSAAAGALVSYARRSDCHLERWPDRTASTDSLVVPDCIALDVAELSDGRVALAWLDPANALRQGIADATLGVVETGVLLDATQAAAQPFEVTATVGGFRVTWVDDDAAGTLRSTIFSDLGGSLVFSTTCTGALGHTLDDYRTFHALRRGASTAVEWAHGASLFGATLAD